MKHYDYTFMVTVLISLIFILLGIIAEYFYIDINNAPMRCLYAQDVVTCVEVSRTKGANQ